MSAHFDINATGFFSLDQWPVTVCACTPAATSIVADANATLSRLRFSFNISPSN